MDNVILVHLIVQYDIFFKKPSNPTFTSYKHYTDQISMSKKKLIYRRYLSNVLFGLQGKLYIFFLCVRLSDTYYCPYL